MTALKSKDYCGYCKVTITLHIQNIKSHYYNTITWITTWILTVEEELRNIRDLKKEMDITGFKYNCKAHEGD